MVFFNQKTKELETELDSITYTSYFLGYTVERIGLYYLLAICSENVPQIYDDQVYELVKNVRRRTHIYFTLSDGVIKECQLKDGYRFLHAYIENDSVTVTLEFPPDNEKFFYISGIFDCDKKIKDYNFSDENLENNT